MRHSACPCCGASAAAWRPIRYGMVAVSVYAQARRGEVVIGPVNHGRNEPQWACSACNTRFGRAREEFDRFGRPLLAAASAARAAAAVAAATLACAASAPAALAPAASAPAASAPAALARAAGAGDEVGCSRRRISRRKVHRVETLEPAALREFAFGHTEVRSAA